MQLALRPNALVALAGFLRSFAELPPPPPEPPTRRRKRTDQGLSADDFTLFIPSNADPIHRVMNSSNPDDWTEVPDGTVDLDGLI